VSPNGRAGRENSRRIFRDISIPKVCGHIVPEAISKRAFVPDGVSGDPGAGQG
jgi:hypothetical protein